MVLRDYAKTGQPEASVAEYLAERAASVYQVKAPQGGVEYLLRSGRAVVVFDGLDELLQTSQRRQVVDAVTAFAAMFPTLPIVVTSRRVGYADAPLPAHMFQAFELTPFSEPQVEQYVRKWFAFSDRGVTRGEHGTARSFLEESAHVSDLRINPLMLSLMCSMYRSERYIPRNRPELYAECSRMLLERWDKERGIYHSLPYGKKLGLALRALALWMFTSPRAGGWPQSAVVERLAAFLRPRLPDPDDAQATAEEFLEFCRGRAWVLTDVGTLGSGESLYAFTHRTFLEFFAAEEVARRNNDVQSFAKVIRSRVQRNEWPVVAELSVQIFDRNVADGADLVLEELLRTPVDARRCTVADANRVAFVARLLQYMQPRRSVIVRVAEDACALATKMDFSPPGNDDWFEPSSRAIYGEALREALSRAPDIGGPVDEAISDVINAIRKKDPLSAALLISLILTGDLLPREAGGGFIVMATLACMRG